MIRGWICKRQVLKQNIIFLSSVLIYRICLDIIYARCIAPFWGYYGFEYEPEMSFIALSWLILFSISFLILPVLKRNNSVISYASVLLFFIRFIPFTSFIACTKQPDNFVLCECVYWFLTFLFLCKGKNIHIPKPHKSAILLNSLILLLIFVVVFISGYYTHFRLNFNLSNVYDLRFEAREYNIPTFLSYLWGPAGNILPIILIYYIQKKKKLLACLILMIILLNFSINGMKSVLFKLLLCLFLCAFMKNKLQNVVFCLFVLLSLLTLLEWHIFDTTFISTLIVRRVLYLPSLLDSYYFDYIYQNAPLYYDVGEGDAHINFLIGEEYFNAPKMLANNGLFSDAYMNLGWIGCIIYPIVYAFFLKLCDSVFRGVNNQISFFCCLLIVYSISNSAFTTALITHGLLLLCLVVYLLSYEELLPTTQSKNLFDHK